MKFSKEAIDVLTRYDWPGNARELANLVEQLIVVFQEGTITPEYLNAKYKQNNSTVKYKAQPLKYGNESLSGHSPRVSQGSPAFRFIKILNELFAAGTITIIGLEDDIYNEISENDTRKKDGFVGWKDKNWYYLLPENTFSAVMKFCRHRGIHFPFKETAVLRNLAAEGCIDIERSFKGTRYRVQKTINNIKRRVIKLKVEAVGEPQK
ncbi:MAG: hypothetical protein K6T65_09225 [Peptococcaceae bacterium]|nr:hypothetical protein [Peptococcaceae bacterium]